MPQYRYLPFLKTKQGEADALERLSSTARTRVFPVFHVSDRPKPRFSASLVQSWAGLPCALDGSFSHNLTGSIADFASVYASLGAGGVAIVPSLALSDSQAYIQALRPFIGSYTTGLILRANPSNLSQTIAFAQAFGVVTTDINLVIDTGILAGFDPQILSGYVLTAISQHLQAGVWRSVTLVGASAPKDFGQLGAGTTLVPRIEWLLWQAVAPQVGFAIDYGDFSMAHPDLTEPPGYAMVNATVSARYTVDNEWVMVKGRSTRGVQGIPMGQQYRQHAQAIANLPNFDLLPTCWGDDQIRAIANGSRLGSGGRTNWVSFGHNRHIELTCNRLT